MYAGGLLQGPAQQWYETLIDPISLELPMHYTLDIFLAEMTAFFGGGLTLASHLSGQYRRVGGDRHEYREHSVLLSACR